MFRGKTLSSVVFLLLVSLLLLSACGGNKTSETQAPAESNTQSKEQKAPAETSAVETAPTKEAAGGAISKISDAKQAIIQIESQGSFVEPGVGQVWNSAGRGSGFIIDPSGLAITNNHVVSGAALLKVWIGGDTSKTYNAKVLGVSECSDLAVIDIEGDGFPYVKWFEGPIDVGKEIYVAGFPLGDPEYSLTKGIISKAAANGETSWASVDSVIEYDATTNPGNSGGAVLTEDAQVVGIHYAGNPDTRQAFGISRDVAKEVIDWLKAGQDMDAIGVNGQAVSNEDGSLVGVWVSSVQSGSPADKAGIKGGDIITTLENLVVATDGTMSDYCDIIRSHNPEDPLNVEVVRFSTGEVLQGQLNGRELAVVGMLDTTADTGGDTGGNTGGDTGGDTTASGTWNPDASASGDFYYQSEFDNTLTDWAYFLMSGKDSGGTSEITDGKLRVELSDQNTWLYFYLDPLDVADVRLDTKVENLGKNNNNVSLFCRYDPDRGWYEFNVANNGEYTIFYYDMLEKTYLALYTGASRDIQMGKSINVITAVCQGNELTLAVNGSILRTVEDNRLSSGKVGLSVSSFNVTPIVVEFDYFYASVP